MTKIKSLKDANEIVKILREENERLRHENGLLRHECAVAKIGHEQLNSFIRQFDAVGLRGYDIGEQVRLACERIKNND